MKNTVEQEQCLAFFSQGQSLRISAYAGSGKTSTLKLLASSTPRQGQYIAFNKAIADEASSRFPQTVNCKTSHSLAFTHVQKHYGFSSEKLNSTANAHKIAEMLHLPASLQVSRRHTMLRTSYGALLGEACKRFLHSAEEIPSIKHFPREHGVLSSYSDEEFQELASIALVPVRELWSLMCNPESRLPIGHDGYLKLWALFHPELPVDYIMLDEAQDSNPAILKVLAAQPCQVVYVGDPYQQIYEWRGAVDAMSRVETPHQALLSQSFRFGPHIADAATKVICGLGATSSVIGNPVLESHLAEVFPDAILCRGNAGVMGSMLALLSNNVRCHVLGGTHELQSLLNDVSRLKRGIPSVRHDLFGFADWSEVQQYSYDSEDANLKKLVKLVSDHGEEKLLAALRKCEVDEEKAQVVLSTAHKAKGQQWEYVALDSDFEKAFNGGTVPQEADGSPRKIPNNIAETRLLYVAITRAQLAVSIPPAVLKVFHLQNTTTAKQGRSIGIAETSAMSFPSIPTLLSRDVTDNIDELQPVIADAPPPEPLKQGDRVKSPYYGEGVVVDDDTMKRPQSAGPHVVVQFHDGCRLLGVPYARLERLQPA